MADHRDLLTGFAVLLAFQLLGEVLARVLHLIVPGPVIGMSLLVVACIASAKLRHACEPAARFLISNLSLLFLPAAVGVVQFLPLVKTEGPVIGLAVLGSTVLTFVVTGVVFRFVVHRLKLENRE